MSQQQQQQQFQPQVYPYNNVPTQPNTLFPPPLAADTTSHSNGSFGTVFWVIGVIIVVSVLACIANRLCTKRTKSSKPSKKDKKGHGHGHGHGQAKLPKEWAGKQSRADFHHDDGGDIEFGFGGKRFPSAKVAAAAAATGEHHPRSAPPMPGFKHHGGGGKGVVRFADDHIDFKPGP
ncbi:uncharacterized protein LOC116027019 [Ipomoea triloba]|uniref:uncharacterized protein LOC116027019 n=1 Tax=Ipomoea triloba TaxID=35885 RepID=UPI00125DDAAB|nr:uncharacterized protein LOC116027019 [Ipomoea triloba]